MTDSRNVAEVTGKRHAHLLRDIDEVTGKKHKHVLRDIDALRQMGGPDLGHLMFQEVTEFGPSANREVRHFLISREGCALLIMGMTGKRALQFKLGYIARFNEMEAELQAKRALPPPQMPQEPKDQRFERFALEMV